MASPAELELTIRRRDPSRYQVDLRFSHPESDVDVRLLHGRAADVALDPAELRALEFDPAGYGEVLGNALVHDPAMRSMLAQVRSSVESLDVPLRLRLLVDPSAAELHALRWETLRDPERGAPLFTGESILFSRYLSSLDWRPVRLRPRAALRALVLIANPSGLEKYAPNGRPLAPVDVAGELGRAKGALGDVPVTPLASGGTATLESLCERLRDGHDILYIVCHGAILEGEPHLWLENADGGVAVTTGVELTTRLQELRVRPSLVVLASCQSAGHGEEPATTDDGALSALGPRLAEAGIPAVVAMQGNVTMETVARFMPVFFSELRKDGQIDRAMSVARGAVRKRPDAWTPVLFMRLRSGRIWYVPGFAEGRGEQLPAVLQSLRKGRCTPILGPGLLESMFGSTRDLARRWAETYRFPLAPHDRDDLPQVAQFLAVNLGSLFPREELGEYLRQELLERYGSDLPPEAAGQSLDDIWTAVGEYRQSKDPAEPHRVLARLNIPLYLTTNPDRLLASALVAAGKTPQVALCPWNEPVERAEMQDVPEPDAQHPLVYHLFGQLGQSDSLVLTEDDYFDYLIGVTRNKDLIPAVVRKALADSALLFLGFHLDDWNFRVLLRSIIGQEGGSRRYKYSHVAVQVDPEEGHFLEPERARRFLEQYFQADDIRIYWGSAEDFIRDLVEQLPAATESSGPARVALR